VLFVCATTVVDAPATTNNAIATTIRRRMCRMIHPHSHSISKATVRAFAVFGGHLKSNG
jgi:hypothetical protein